MSCETCHSAVDHSNLLKSFVKRQRPRLLVLRSAFMEGQKVRVILCNRLNFVGLATMYSTTLVFALESFLGILVLTCKRHGANLSGLSHGECTWRRVIKTCRTDAVVEGKTYPDRERSSHRFIGQLSLLDEFPIR